MNSSINLFLTAGLDEAGRGPLAGPVVAAAVVLHPDSHIPGLNDSKLLTEAKREALFPLIQQNAVAWAVAEASVNEIDTINILQATMLAMQRAFAALTVVPHLALVDGNYPPKLNCQVQTIVDGDQSEPAISAASILAKVTRDRLMVALDKEFPEYGFAQHKGYGTKQHLQALRRHGATTIHRNSFAPVQLAQSLMAVK